MKKFDLVFAIDTNYESLAIAESAKLGIPIVAILDSTLILIILIIQFQVMMMQEEL